MSIETIYRTILLNDYVKQQVESSTIPSSDDIEDKATSLSEEDLSKPKFDASDNHVKEDEESSATKLNSTLSSIRTDLRVAYKEMFELTKTSIDSFERWYAEATNIEKSLVDLEGRIDNLLLLAQDTEGYNYFVQENYTDLSQVDYNLTTALVDLGKDLVTLGPTASTTRIFLNEIKRSDVDFKIRTTQGFVSRSDLTKASIENIFKQTSDSWWTLINMQEIKPVTCELIVKLGEDPIEISKISLELLDSAQSSPMYVTPLLSLDNYNYSPLKSVVTNLEIRSKGTFSLPPTKAKYIKFILTKNGPDPGTSNGFGYQFGFKTISFFSEAYTESSEQSIYSTPLSVLDIDNNPVAFSKIALKACERLEDDTKINYFITLSNNSSVPVGTDTTWYSISPSEREAALTNKVISVGNLIPVVATGVKVSYDGTATSLINPASGFYLLSKDSNGSVTAESVTATSSRYSFLNKQDRILNYQIKDNSYSGSGDDPLDFNRNSIKLFRNVGEKGLGENDSTAKVRDIHRGWRFEEPYYISIVQIKNPEGFSIDVGNEPIIIDDVQYTNLVSPDVLSKGLHEVKVHKNSWKHVATGATSFSDLKTKDPLYPYNHKLLVEGYTYTSSYTSTDEKIYSGVDLFAAQIMKEVSIFDFLGNIPADGYKYFALDRDAPGTHTGGNESTLVFCVKVDEENPDFTNETWKLELNLIDQNYKYLRLRADLSTSDSTVAPILDGWQLKLGD